LWEQGLIDQNNLSHYTMGGRKDALGCIIPGTSLRELMLTCPDFVNEEGSLQHVAKMLGVMVMLTPKCHPEMAGEVVEFAWAGANNAYHNLALKDKKESTTLERVLNCVCQTKC